MKPAAISLLKIGLLLLFSQRAGATVFNIANGDVPALKAAITTANSNQQDDIINLAANGSYLISAADNGRNGLPIVGVDGGHTLTINGNGATLSRTGAGTYRLLQVSFATVVVNALIMQNGELDPSDTPGDGQFGGAILNDHGNLTVTNCTFLNNHGYDGGALANDAASGNASLTVLNSTFAQNHVGRSGAALFNNQGTFAMTNCTISGNYGDGILGGNPGIASFGGNNKVGSGTIVHCTFYRNVFRLANPAFGDSGISVNQSTVTISNSILVTADLTLPVIVNSQGTVISNGYNVANDDEGGFLNAIGDQTDTDPRLAPLANNGGPTQTHALMNDSPALDTGDPNATVTTDQRGQPRPVDFNGDGWNRSDAGAYERQAADAESSFVVTTLDDHSDGTCNAADCTLREAMTAANSKGGFPGITFRAGLSGPVNLKSALPAITSSMGIYGPGVKVITVARNSAGSYGLFNVSNNNLAVTISGLTLSNGNTDHGAAILNQLSLVTVLDCLISGNTDSFGGALFAAASGQTSGQSTFRLGDCTFSNNTAGLNGGAFYLDGSGGGTADVRMRNCTFFNNSASNDGGAIFANGFAGKIVLQAFGCTFSGNSAPTGDTLCTDFRNSGSVAVVLGNTILNKPSTGTNFATADGATPSSGYSIGHNISNDNGSGLLTATGDMINTNPHLDANGLQDNGGDTPTIAVIKGLFFTSPAIDAGSSSIPPSRDQRGLLRNGAPDIGAYEFNGITPPQPTPTPTPTATPTASPTPTATPPALGLVGNVSTRLPVGTGDNVLIEGFTVQGPAGSAKKIIVRAIGPSLAAFGITDALPNPTLEIHDADNNNAVVATNDDWKVTQVGGFITSDQSAEISASGFAPGNDLESAIIANLAPGSYTAVVRGAGDSVGTGVVDAFDLSAAASARLVNVATRGLIQPGDKLMIAGFITQNGSVRAVVRAIGPSLAAFGIANALPDTTLQLRDGNGALVIENDDWKIRSSDGTSQQAEIEATGLQPIDDREAAVVTALPPGQYTAQVRGKPETTGTGVVQVYFLP
jgi:CSLREA domain-containing protein